MNLIFNSGIRKNRPKKNANLITSGTGFAAVIQTTGRVACWGLNSLGGLGDNSVTSKITLVNLGGSVKTFCKIDAVTGSNQNLAIDKNGRAWGWGGNYNGQLSIQPENAVVLTPVRVCNI